jgi:Strictosidine synthase-like, N-terminal
MRHPPLRPVVWQPPAAPTRAKACSGPLPLPPVRLLELDGTDPEDVVVDAAGRIVTGVEDSRLPRIDRTAAGSRWWPTPTGGRSASSYLATAGCWSATRGAACSRWTPRERGRGAVGRVAGEPMLFCNNAFATRQRHLRARCNSAPHSVSPAIRPAASHPVSCSHE